MIRNSLHLIDSSSCLSRTAEAASSALPKRDPQWLEVKIGEFYGEEQPAGMSVPEFALTLIQLLQVEI